MPAAPVFLQLIADFGLYLGLLAARVSSAGSILDRYRADCRGSKAIPSNARGDGSVRDRCLKSPGANRLLARRRYELKLVRALRCLTGSSPARAIKARFHSCTLTGVTASSRTASILSIHLARPPPR
ncbi:MAG TPA: hypothetical protein VE860_27515 [Chthoniobacterales bacterium]|nr:hypothetical protein [Chthoniobacterales bacterium]